MSVVEVDRPFIIYLVQVRISYLVDTYRKIRNIMGSHGIPPEDNRTLL